MELELVFVVSWKPPTVFFFFLVIVYPFLFVILFLLFLRGTN
jgi:hypothetical protein